MINLLIIGGGAIADCTHIPAAKQLLGVEHVWLAELNKAQADKLQQRHGLIHVVSDYHEALDNVDACIICTPPHVRNGILRDCVSAGKHVLCEKPLSPSSKETNAILAQAPKGLVMGMCHTYRHFPNRQWLRKQIQDGFFGSSIHIDIHEGGPFNWPTVSGYCVRKDLVPGGVLYDCGIHSMDFVLWCLGQPQKVAYKDDCMGGLENNATMHLTYPNATADLQFSRTYDVSNTLVVEGNGHKAVLGIYDNQDYVLDGVKQKAMFAPEVKYPDNGCAQLQNFLDAIEGKAKILCPIEQGVEVIELLEQCYAQRQPIQYEKKPLGGLKGKTVFITGGTGFIGSHIVEQLVLHEDAKVRVLVHTWAKAAFVSHLDVEFVQADILDCQQMVEASKGCDYIIHAAIVGGKGHDEFVANNVKATENIMAAAKANKIASVVQFSSVVVHGETVPTDLTADSPLISYGDNYADAKLEAEKRFWQLLDEYHLHGSIIRPTYVWGPYSMWYTIFPMQQMKKGEFSWVDMGRGMCNAVYVGNVVDLCLTCLTNPKADQEAFIAADGEQSTWYDFYSPLMRLLNMNPDRVPSIPLCDGVGRKIRLAWKKHLLSINESLCRKIDETEKTDKLKAKLLYRLPRKSFRMLRKMVTYRLPVMAPDQFAIYSQHTPINVTKNEQVLGFKPRYTLRQSQEITLNWLKQSNLYV